MKQNVASALSVAAKSLHIWKSFAKQGAQTEQLVFEGGHDKWWYPVPNLYAELTIGDRKAADHKFLCYMGHIDVVPVGEEKLWRRPPFPGRLTKVSSGGGAQRT